MTNGSAPQRPCKRIVIQASMAVFSLLCCCPDALPTEFTVPVSERLSNHWTASQILPCDEIASAARAVKALLEQRGKLVEELSAAVANNREDKAEAISRSILVVDTRIRQRRVLQEVLGARDYAFTYIASGDRGLPTASGLNAIGFVLGQSWSQTSRAVPPFGAVAYLAGQSNGKLRFEFRKAGEFENSWRSLSAVSELQSNAVRSGGAEFSLVVNAENDKSPSTCTWAPHSFQYSGSYFEKTCSLFDFSPIDIIGKGDSICRELENEAGLGSYVVSYDVPQFREWFGGPVNLKYRIGARQQSEIPESVRELIYRLLDPLVRDAFGPEKSYRVSDDILARSGVRPERRESARLLLDAANKIVEKNDPDTLRPTLDRLLDSSGRYAPSVGYRVELHLPMPTYEAVVVFERTEGGLDISEVREGAEPISDPNDMGRLVCPHSVTGAPVSPRIVDGTPLCLLE